MTDQQPACERCDNASMWRSGAGLGATVLDIVRAEFADRKRHSAVLRDFDRALDGALQKAFDMTRSEAPQSYQEAQASERRIIKTVRAHIIGDPNA
jgi:hypothetical protein